MDKTLCTSSTIPFRKITRSRMTEIHSLTISQLLLPSFFFPSSSSSQLTNFALDFAESTEAIRREHSDLSLTDSCTIVLSDLPPAQASPAPPPREYWVPASLAFAKMLLLELSPCSPASSQVFIFTPCKHAHLSPIFLFYDCYNKLPQT